MTMTPKQYADKYKNLKVQFEDATTSTVSVTKYRIGMGDERTKDKLWKAIKKHFKSNDSLTVTVFPARESSSVEREFQSANEIKFSALNAFWGKASPEEMQVTLQLAVKFEILAKENLRAYCATNKIGTDCSGFAGNYIARILRRKPWYEQVGDGAVGPKSKSNSIFNRYTRITQLDQLAAGKTYVLAYCNTSGTPHGSHPTGHIVITEPVRIQDTRGICRADGDSLARFTVSESTSGVGIATSEYQIREALRAGTRKAYFKVHRGSKNRVLTMALAEVTTTS